MSKTVSRSMQCNSDLLTLVIIASLACVFGAGARPPSEAGETASTAPPVGHQPPGTRLDDDPAHVAGQWNYRTRSNCGPVEGVGSVSFTWDGEAGGYHERGHVFWPHSGLTIRWWGLVRYDPVRRQLTGRVQNSLGDSVDAHWQLEGPGPDRLVVSWNQTNGCRGRGVASR